MTTKTTLPSAWMYKDGNGKILKDDIVKTTRGWEKIYPDGHKELIHALHTPGNLPPSISSITNHTAGTYDNATDLTFVVEFDEIVNVVTTNGTPALEVYTEAGTLVDIPYVSGTGTTELTFTGPATGVADGSLQVMTEIAMNGGTILDASGNWLNNDFPSDYVQPSITINDGVLLSVTNPDDGYYDTNSTVSFTATFSEAMTVVTTGGTPTISVYTDPLDVYTCSYASGSGTDSLVFTGDLTGMADGTLVVDEQIELNGGTILDADDNAPDSLVFPGSYTQPSMTFVDAVIASVTNHADGVYPNEATPSFTVTFSEAVTVDTAVGTPSLQVYSDGDTETIFDLDYASGTGTTDLVFTGSLATMRYGNLVVVEVHSLNGGTIVGVGTTAVSTALPSDYAQPSIEIYDAIIASVTNHADGIATDTESLSFTVTFNEAVTVDTALGTPSLQVYSDADSGTIFDLDYASGTGTTDLVFTGTMEGVDGGNLVVVEDLALNLGTIVGGSANDVYLTFPDDYTQPTIAVYDAVVSTVTNHADGTYDDTEVLSFTVAFNEAVTVDDAGGTPSLQVYTQVGTLVDIPYASGTGTTDLVFSGALTGIADGSLVIEETLALNGGTIVGASSTGAYLTFPDAYVQPTITMSTP